MFNTDGTINGAARPAMPNAAPYAPAFQPMVRFGTLQEVNQRHYNVGIPHGGMPLQLVDLACHHVVGWDIIWNFWNKLIDGGAYKQARKYLGLAGAAQAITGKLEQWCKNDRFMDPGHWEQTLCWKVNNLVRGPNDRSDDPSANHGFINKIDFKSMGTNVYKGRLVTLVELGTRMCDVIGSAGPLPIPMVDKILNGWSAIQGERMMEWNEELWRVDDALPGYSNTPSPAGGGFTVVKPRWKIHSART